MRRLTISCAMSRNDLDIKDNVELRCDRVEKGDSSEVHFRIVNIMLLYPKVFENQTISKHFVRLKS
jgi:hypothetical protein